MRNTIIILSVIVAMICLGVAYYYQKNATIYQAELNEERYLRISTEEKLQNAENEIRGLESEIAKIENKLRGQEKLLQQTQAVNEDLKARLDKAAQIKKDLEAKIQELMQISL